MLRNIKQKIFKSPFEANLHFNVEWRWMPTLYVSKGLAYVVLFLTSLILFKRLGVNNSELTFFISCCFLPLWLRPILSLFVHISHYHRGWILGTQLLFTLSIAGIAYALANNEWTDTMPLLYGLLSVSTVFYDISTDKYILNAINSKQLSTLSIRKLSYYLIAMLIGLGIIVMMAGNLEVLTRMIKSSWSTAFYMLSMLLGILWIWNLFILPRTINRKREYNVRVADMFYASLNTLADLIRMPRSWSGILFILFYILPFVLLAPISMLFTIDLGSSGGLCLSPQEFGFTQGTVGVFALALGVIIGFCLLLKHSLFTMLPWMTIALCLPNIIYVYLSFTLPNNITWISCCIFVQQLTCGFGLFAYLRYIVYYSEVKRFATYPLCLSLTTLSVMCGMMISGSLQQAMGYRQYFILTTFCCIAPVVVSLIVLGVERKSSAFNTK